MSETCIDAVSESESTLSGRDSNMAPILNLSIGHWAGFCAFVLGALALDLGLFHRQGRKFVINENGRRLQPMARSLLSRA